MLYEQIRKVNKLKNIYTSIEQMTGKTPMYHFVKLQKKLGLKADIFGKCEFYNPLFSIKDRAALQMINKVLDEKDKKNKMIIEATSGNLGVAMAAVCAQKEVKALAIMPENTAVEKIKMIKHFGADVILTPKEDGMSGAIAKVEMLAMKSEDVIWLRQFENEANIEAHLFHTAVEIWDDMEGKIDGIVAAVGTSGTLSGIARALKSSAPDMKVVAVEPKSSNVLNGGKKGKHNIHGIGAGFVPPLYKAEMVDEIKDIEDNDAWDMAKLVAQVEGLPIGVSAGAAMAAAVDLAQDDGWSGKNMVVILPDAINNYLSEL